MCSSSYETNDNATCVWCLAKAVPSVCVSDIQAKRLPPGVFVCDSNQTTIEQESEMTVVSTLLGSMRRRRVGGGGGGAGHN